MNYTIVQSSELSKWKRMDARFFIALHSIESRYNELKKTIPEDVIRQHLALLTPKEKEPCLVLGRGQGGTDKLAAIEKEYPYLAWALIETTLLEIRVKRQIEIDNLQAQLNHIQQIGDPNV